MVIILTLMLVAGHFHLIMIMVVLRTLLFIVLLIISFDLVGEPPQ